MSECSGDDCPCHKREKPKKILVVDDKPDLDKALARAIGMKSWLKKSPLGKTKTAEPGDIVRMRDGTLYQVRPDGWRRIR